ncbi:MAG: MaoC family dehydratase [Pseudopelagicola sp.]|nr:MaoC family dehydratase [Pseudopelagicola sp.]
MYFDELPVGYRFEGEAQHEVSEEEIIAFARQWDPQPFHTDPEAAKETAYGGLIASGLQTMSIALRQVLDMNVWADSSMGSSGLDEVRWQVPVRPGDRIRARGEVLSSTPSASRPDRGRTEFLYEAVNQRDEVVMRYRATQILKRKL